MLQPQDEQHEQQQQNGDQARNDGHDFKTVRALTYCGVFSLVR
jgi:hypothetical protein